MSQFSAIDGIHGAELGSCPWGLLPMPHRCIVITIAPGAGARHGFGRCRKNVGQWREKCVTKLRIMRPASCWCPLRASESIVSTWPGSP